MIACAMEDSRDTNAVHDWAKVDHVIAHGKTAILARGKLVPEFPHFRMGGQHFACLHNGIQKQVSTLAASTLPSNEKTDFYEIVIRSRGDFKARHRLHQLLWCIQPAAHSCLDSFDVQRDSLAALKLLDALVDVAEKLFTMPQEFDGFVEGLVSIVKDADRDDMLKELLVFWRKMAAHGISPFIPITLNEI
jgi:hypothetical protein